MRLAGVAAMLLAAAICLWPAESSEGRRRPWDARNGPDRDLERARLERRALRAGTRDLDEVLQLHRTLRSRWPREGAVTAELAFRSGELLRAAGRHDEALEAFREAQLGFEDADLRARAGLEAAHVLRRTKRHEEALTGYLDVYADRGHPAARRDEGAFWGARMYVAMGNVPAAKRLMQRVADGAVRALQRVRAWDELALLALEEEDYAAAAGILQACRDALTESAREKTAGGRRVRAAIARMRALTRLRNALRTRATAEDSS